MHYAPSEMRPLWNPLHVSDPLLGKYLITDALEMCRIIWHELQHVEQTSLGFAAGRLDWEMIAQKFAMCTKRSPGAEWTGKDCRIVWHYIAYGNIPSDMTINGQNMFDNQQSPSGDEDSQMSEPEEVRDSIVNNDLPFSRRDRPHSKKRLRMLSQKIIEAVIPSRKKHGLGLRIEEIEIGNRQAVVMGHPHAHSMDMDSFEIRERAKIKPGMELIAINGAPLNPPTLERAVELVSSAATPVKLTLIASESPNPRYLSPTQGGHRGGSPTKHRAGASGAQQGSASKRSKGQKTVHAISFTDDTDGPENETGIEDLALEDEDGNNNSAAVMKSMAVPVEKDDGKSQSADTADKPVEQGGSASLHAGMDGEVKEAHKAGSAPTPAHEVSDRSKAAEQDAEKAAAMPIIEGEQHSLSENGEAPANEGVKNVGLAQRGSLETKAEADDAPVPAESSVAVGSAFSNM